MLCRKIPTAVLNKELETVNSGEGGGAKLTVLLRAISSPNHVSAFITYRVVLQSSMCELVFLKECSRNPMFPRSGNKISLSNFLQNINRMTDM